MGRIKAVSTSMTIASLGTYTANDVISQSTASGTAWAFPNVARTNGEGGYITKATALLKTTGKVPALSMFLYNGIPTGQLNDNAANLNIVAADVGMYQGLIDFPAMETIGSGYSMAIAPAGTVSGNMPLGFTCAKDSRNLYGVLVTRSALLTGTNDTVVISFDIDQY